jgi:peptidyl-dipeptidase Dcp
MKKINHIKKFVLFIVLFSTVLFFVSCTSQSTEKPGKQPDETHTAELQNPFFKEWKTPFGLPPYDEIKDEHFLPAYKKAMEEEIKEIDAIINNPESPTFENTLVALEKSGDLLYKVSRVFSQVNGADTNDKRKEIRKEVTPLLSKHRSSINLNEQLFQRIKAVYDKRETLKLNAEQKRLLDKRYERFVRSGANLKPEDKKKVKQIDEELSSLRVKFSNNLLEETNSFKIFLDKKEDLAGLPQSVIKAAAEAAEREGHKGKWLFTLHKPSWIPFLQYSTKRNLREKLYKGYINRGDNNNEFDNKKIIAKMASLRLEKAKIMGYKTHADFRLEINMAKNPQGVYGLLDKLWVPALKMAKNEAKTLQAMIDKEDGKFKLESWDWWYYTEKLRKEKYALDDSQLRPYFKLDNVREGAFYVANKLYGIKFKERKDIPTYHKDVQVFEVLEADGSHLGILFTDYFYRTSKRGGAWCGSVRRQSNIAGEKVHPVTFNVCNFPPPVGDKPSLITFENANTLFHEFGHALNNLFNKTSYPGISRAPRDYTEFPAQIMEHWCSDPEVMKVYARHYQTDKSIPQELIDKLEKSSHFNQGFITLEYLAASYLDMNWHTITDPKPVDTNKFENDYFKKIGLIPEIISRYRSTYFRHITSGYDAGYYAYIWANVLDCDAFEAFKETSLFDQKTAQSLRENLLATGNLEDPMVLYKRFRGAEPKIDGLLKKRGLK